MVNHYDLDVIDYLLLELPSQVYFLVHNFDVVLCDLEQGVIPKDTLESLIEPLPVL